MLSWFPASIVVAARTTGKMLYINCLEMVCEKVPGTSGTNMFTGCIFNAHGIVWPTWWVKLKTPLDINSNFEYLIL